ncbi:phosphoglycerate mutase family protein [Mongoliibacter ruber]|uniref:Phosphohistidine phosphatase SixA n=1 Tax=Mongoliibacter ruber TaxID=1750599 RepID=A0A2T0WJ60_9BACT|nr:phosphoglycerate mutase family protein [Mongoliibacter ruber]PRY86574.1 phosphohistidine phosphatase SixA [Mongoliibacter ruber]
MRNFTKIILVIVLMAIMEACSQKQEPKTIYIVRHAEKLLTGDDPELSVAGAARAVKLGQILEGEEIAHIFSTNTIRTVATVRHVSNHSGAQIEAYDTGRHDDLVKELKQRKGNILVVGHSNTIHHLVNYFINDDVEYEELKDVEYDFIFKVTLDERGNSMVERKIYRDFN